MKNADYMLYIKRDIPKVTLTFKEVTKKTTKDNKGLKSGKAV